MERGGSREADTLLEASEGKDMSLTGYGRTCSKCFYPEKVPTEPMLGLHHPSIFSGLVCESSFATSGNRLDPFLDRAYR